MAQKWQRIRFMPGTGIGENGERVTAGSAHASVARQAAEEGMVLLKNTEGFLPLKGAPTLAVFGKAQSDYVQGGGGSGFVYSPYKVSLLQALREAAQAGEISLVEPLSTFYADYVKEQYAAGSEPGRIAEPEIPSELMEEAEKTADIAVITICRFSGEGWERSGKVGDGDFYLSPEEQKMVDQVTEKFSRVLVILNTGGMMDTSWMREKDNVKAVLLAWQAGMEGGHCTVDILLGKVTPSGHLTDTFATDFDAYPSSAGFMLSDEYVEYTEDIFVGYRYFSTIPGADKKVVYPFGFGLSYASFVISDEAFAENAGDYSVCARVTNTAEYAGKDVLQVYVESPKTEVDRPARILVGYEKTDKLAKDASQACEIRFTDREIAAYDEARHAWIVPQGQYSVYLGENVRDAKEVATFTVAETRILEIVENHAVSYQLSKRLHSDGTYEDIETKPYPRELDYLAKQIIDGAAPAEKTWVTKGTLWGEPEEKHLIDVFEGKVDLDTFLDQLSDEQMIHMLGGQPNRGCANTFGFGNIPRFGIPNVMTADGPAGLRITPEAGVETTAFPCATLLACSWNEQVLEAVGDAAAKELKENGFGVWLAPALNIHRNPLCGRNFEYYSEDPLVAGKCAAAMVRGIQKNGIAATIKHFACNNKETNRRDCDSRLSEQALREIYLRGFEICVKEADPWCLMTSYNPVNGVRASENRELITDILRGEWGFKGMVTTDWYTYGGQYLEVSAGNDVKMGKGMPEHTLQMLQEGKIAREDIRASAKRVLELILKLD